MKYFCKIIWWNEKENVYLQHLTLHRCNIDEIKYLSPPLKIYNYE